ncbi:hypothetical protein SteCoe_7150 [Stentor coeruleus]|uniref:Peptidase M16 N-terminal domain-containing protein n=1 Tax=Stentor coeruleus TaxID=5963 RepID=A0A1R2CN58_9CILI|nr:hypothetical protein SteCoe_7150 [Stentor coeruleus]
MSEITIEKSPNDSRDYKYFILPNNIKCLIVSDPESQYSSASMNVHIGSIHEDIHGLAHFLEHMLFLGTSKYPIENHYKSYLKSHGGQSNAFTASEDTNFYFKIASESFFQALDIFAQFFISPLFNADSVARELKAVDSEYNKNILDDNWRFYQILKDSMNSPYNHFGLGCSKTLDIEGIRDKVIEFYEKYYSSNVMSLVLYGKEKTEILEQWAKDLFSQVIDKGVVLKSLDKPIFGDVGKIIKIVPMKNVRTLRFLWPLPSIIDLFQYQSDWYISNLLGHEGKNSILSYLKNQNLAEALGSYSEIFYTTCTNVVMDIKLTEKGLEQYEHIIEIVSQYTEFLRNNDPEEFVFEELQAVALSKFKFKNKEDPFLYAKILAVKLAKYPPSKVLTASELFEVYDKNVLKDMISYLNPENAHIYLISEGFDKSLMDQEKWFGTFVQKEDFTSELKHKMANPKVDTSLKNLCYPTKNPYITRYHEILTPSTQNFPVEISKNPKSRVWYKPNHKFLIDKVHGQLIIFCNSIGFYNSVFTYILAEIWLKLFKEKYREEIYLAEIAGLQYELLIDSHGIKITLECFSEKYCDFFEYLIRSLANFTIENEDFNIFEDIKSQTLVQMKNRFLDKPYEQVRRLLFETCLQGGYFTVEDKIKALEKIGFDDLVWFSQKWLKSVFFEWIVIGNITAESVLALTNKCVDNFLVAKSSTLMTQSEFLSMRAVKIPKNSSLLYKNTIKEPSETNSAVISLWQIGPENEFLQATLSLIDNFINEPCFNILRTKEQLGYIVWSYTQKFRGILNFLILIQSSVKSPTHIFNRISSFISYMKTCIHSLSDEDFDKLVQSTKKKTFKNDISIKEEFNRFKLEIDSGAYWFDRKEKIKAQLENVRKDNMVKVFEKMFFEDNRRLDVEVLPMKMVEEEEKEKEKVDDRREVVEDLDVIWRKNSMWGQVYVRK